MKRLAVHWDTIKTPVENFLLMREARIAGERQALINQEAAGYTKWFGLIKVGPFTQEEATERLKNEESRHLFYGNHWVEVAVRGSGWEERAIKLLKACDLAYKDQSSRNGDGRVWLDDNDVSLVRGEVGA